MLNRLAPQSLPDVPLLGSPAGESASPHRLKTGSRRLAGISASLVGTSAVTSALGLAFWTIAARTLDAAAVGVAGAAVAMMMLIGSLGSLGLGTLLISRLPVAQPGARRRLVRSCLCLAGSVAAVLSLLTVWPAIRVFGMDNLRPVVSTPASALLLCTGTALTAMTMVLDQAVLVQGFGSLQLERNIVASVAKIAALLAIVAAGAHGGLGVLLAWTVGNAVSLPLVAYRTRGGRPLEDEGPLIDLRVLRGMGREATSHHALNLGLQVPLQVLPVVVTVLLSARADGYFSTALLVTGFVYTLPFALSVGLFAAAEGDERLVLGRLRWTVPFGLAVSLAADIALYPCAGLVLGVFGSSYVTESTGVLRILVLAGIPFVIKDHFVALRRVQHRTTEAAVVVAVLSVLELAAAAAGAHWAGLIGLSSAWVGATALEALIFMVPLIRGARTLDGLAAVAPTTAPMGIPLEVPQKVSPPTLVDSFPDVRARETSPSSDRSTGRPSDSRHAVRTPKQRPERDLLGLTLVVMCAGLVVMALAAAAARQQTPSPWLDLLYAVGLATVFLPAAARIAYWATGKRERVILGLALPTLLQLSGSVLHPTYFAYHDELVHLNTLRLISQTHHLFTENPLLPVSSYYPGLEIVADGVRCLTGLSPFISATIVLILARIVLAAAFMALITALSGSLRLASIAGVLYCCNPQMIFFNAQFSYQTIALPLAVLTAYLVYSRGSGVRSVLAGGTTLIAVAVSHHLTSILLVAALGVWTILECALRRHRQRRHGGALAALTGVGLIAVVLMALNPGNPVRGYLVAIVQTSTTQVSDFTSGHSTKVTFTDSAGSASLPWEQILMVSAVVIVTLALPIALVAARPWWHRRVPLAIGLILLSALYPIIPLAHLTQATAEVGDRAAGFVFVGVAFVLAWALQDQVMTWRWSVIAGLVATVVFVGNVIFGAGPIGSQLPGPYEVSADARSIDVRNLAAAHWMAENLPPDSRVYADRVAGLLAASVGGQFTVQHISTGVDASRLLLDPQVTAADLAVARAARIRYVIVDERDADSLPHEGVYIELGEFGEDTRTQPVPLTALRKLAHLPGIQKIYDNGSIMVYDIKGMRLAQ